MAQAAQSSIMRNGLGTYESCCGKCGGFAVSDSAARIHLSKIPAWRKEHISQGEGGVAGGACERDAAQHNLAEGVVPYIRTEPRLCFQGVTAISNPRTVD